MRSYRSWRRVARSWLAVGLAAAWLGGCNGTLQGGLSDSDEGDIVAPADKADFTVWASSLPGTLTIAPSPARSGGAALTLTGTGFQPSKQVKIRAALPLELRTFYAQSDGAGKFAFATQTSQPGWYRYYALQIPAGKRRFELVAAAEVTVTDGPTRCGDGVCDENCTTCPADCGSCPVTPRCGDGTCATTETCSSCVSDCGPCAPPTKLDGGTAPGKDSSVAPTPDRGTPVKDGSVAPTPDRGPTGPVDLGTVPGKTYYASPQGGGTGASATSAFRISDFFKVAKPGDRLLLLDGTYTGAAQMITPPDNLSGESGKPIVVQALNDGKAAINGEFQRAPVLLERNSWWVLRGFNAHSAGPPGSSESVFSVKYSSNVVAQRIVGWDATPDGNNNVFGAHNSDHITFEDCAAFGYARKMFSNSQNGNFVTFRRCFFRFERNKTYEGPKLGMTIAYESDNALVENCVGTFDTLTGLMPKSYQATNYQGVPNPAQEYFRDNYTLHRGGAIISDDGQSRLTLARILGSLFFVAKDQQFHNELGQYSASTGPVQRDWAGPITFHSAGTTVKDSISVLEPGSNNKNELYYVASLEGGQSSNSSLTNSTLIGGVSERNKVVRGSWTFESNYISKNGADLVANGGNILDPTKNNVPNAANLMFRYVNGVKTNQPLWPWPMNQRILDAMATAKSKPMDVTRKVFELCGGTMPTFAK